MIVDVQNYVLMPLLIFLARVTDVSIGTFRIILFSKNKKFLVTGLAFIEIMIWLLAVRQIILNLTNPVCYIAFAAGFATGNYVGLMLEERIALGYALVRIITNKKADQLINALKEKNIRLTRVPAKGSQGDVDIIFTIIKRTQLAQVKRIVQQFNPQAFYSVEDVKDINEAVPLRASKSFFRFNTARK